MLASWYDMLGNVAHLQWTRLEFSPVYRDAAVNCDKFPMVFSSARAVAQEHSGALDYTHGELAKERVP